MTRSELSKLLNGREYLSEMTFEEENIAKENGLVVIFGYSDDCIEFRGAIYDELGCFDGGDFYVDATGIYEASGGEFKRYKITAEWCKGDIAWTYTTDIPHDTFDIWDHDSDDNAPYCRGIVFDINDLEGDKTND